MWECVCIKVDLPKTKTHQQLDTYIHPKLHSITHSLISRNSRKLMFALKISLLIVTFLSLTSQICHQWKPPKKSTHTLALRHVSISGVSPSSSSSSSYVTCWMLVHAYATSSGKAKWSGPRQRRWEENEYKFHSLTCYINLCYMLHITHPC